MKVLEFQKAREIIGTKEKSNEQKLTVERVQKMKKEVVDQNGNIVGYVEMDEKQVQTSCNDAMQSMSQMIGIILPVMALGMLKDAFQDRPKT